MGKVILNCSQCSKNHDTAEHFRNNKLFVALFFLCPIRKCMLKAKCRTCKLMTDTSATYNKKDLDLDLDKRLAALSNSPHCWEFSVMGSFILHCIVFFVSCLSLGVFKSRVS